jgi:hypothetical protein
MSYFILWLCGVAGNIGTFFIVAGAIYLAFSIVLMFMKLCANAGNCSQCFHVCMAKTMNKVIKGSLRHIFMALGILFLGCITPSTPQCYAIFGVGTALEYVNNSEEVQKLPDNAFKALNYYLESVTDKKTSKEKE